MKGTTQEVLFVIHGSLLWQIINHFKGNLEELRQNFLPLHIKNRITLLNLPVQC